MGVYTDKALELRPLIELAVQSLDDDQSLAAETLFPAWQSGTNYITGTKIRYNGILYKVIQGHESNDTWAPDAAPSLYAKVLTDPSGEPQLWEQPDSTNPYMKGDKVIFDGEIYESYRQQCMVSSSLPGCLGDHSQIKRMG